MSGTAKTIIRDQEEQKDTNQEWARHIQELYNKIVDLEPLT